MAVASVKKLKGLSSSSLHGPRGVSILFMFVFTVVQFLYFALAGFSPMKILAVSVTVILFAVLLTDRSHYWFPRLALLIGTTYILLCADDSLLLYCRPLAVLCQQDRLKDRGIKGLYTPDEKIGYTLTPNWHGYYDDGRVRVEYRINSLGHRDDEPSSDGTARRRLLLIGDSFTCGLSLDQSQNIDKHIERLTRGEVDAYNLGVNGYGPPQILETLSRASHLKFQDVVYLFHTSDLEIGQLVPDGGRAVVDGYMVRRYDYSGNELYPDKEAMQASVRRYLDLVDGGFWADVRSIVKLRHLRELVRLVLKPRKPTSEEDALLSATPRAFSIQHMEQCVGYTAKMRDLCKARNAGFKVLDIPTPNELKAKRRAAIHEEYVKRLRESGIGVIDIRDRILPKDYRPYDLHFTESGAVAAAEAIVESLRDVTL